MEDEKIFLKRVFDLTLSLIGIILLSPFLVIIGLAVYIKLGSPIIFKQIRPGLNGKPFWIYKFRSMTNERDDRGNLLDNEKRLIPFGIKLRRTSLDELPELINVLKGDMSLVGPRPLKMEYLSRYSEEQARRNEIRPGITGWAQVNGRNTVSWDKRFRLDVWYIDHQSIWLDIKIIFMTLSGLYIKQRKTLGSDKTITAPFQGSEKKNPKEMQNCNSD